ncbi:hypothetical protein AAH991_24900 [Microbispora sp. ZYX-F-249]|uniref:Uncharacterized protein n=1 Tax=Microbispora maris TaxID=3144104 RepID=A0ABV0ASW0_9ACTN
MSDSASFLAYVAAVPSFAPGRAHCSAIRRGGCCSAADAGRTAYLKDGVVRLLP